MNISIISMLKYNLSLFFLFTSCWFLHAQSNLDIKIYQPRMETNLKGLVGNDLALKLESIFSQHGVYNASASVIGIYPSLQVVETSQIEGLKRLHTVKVNLGLTTKNSITGLILYTHLKTLTGAASEKSQAIRKAIQSIRPNHPEWKKMIKTLEERIQQYYEESCDELLGEAHLAVEQNLYPKAISLLQAIPSKSDCHNKSASRLVAVYQDYQQKECSSFIHQANLSITQKKFDDAIDWLTKIDVDSPCATEAASLLKTAGEGVEQQQNAKLKFLNQVYQNKVKMEDSRKRAIEQISEDYLKKN